MLAKIVIMKKLRWVRLVHKCLFLTVLQSHVHNILGKINWISLTCPETDKTFNNLLDLTKDFHLHQAVQEPTI